MSRFSAYWSGTVVSMLMTVYVCVSELRCAAYRVLLIFLHPVADSQLLVFLKDHLYFKGRVS